MLAKEKCSMGGDRLALKQRLEAKLGGLCSHEKLRQEECSEFKTSLG